MKQISGIAWINTTKRWRDMALTRREILEELLRIGITRLEELKKACREYETFCENFLNKRAIN